MRLVGRRDLAIAAQLTGAIYVDRWIAEHAPGSDKYNGLRELAVALASALFVVALTNGLFRLPRVTVGWKYEGSAVTSGTLMLPRNGNRPTLVVVDVQHHGGGSALSAWVCSRLRKRDELSLILEVTPERAALLSADLGATAPGYRQVQPSQVALPLSKGLRDGLVSWARLEFQTQTSTPAEELGLRIRVEGNKIRYLRPLIAVDSRVRKVRFH